MIQDLRDKYFRHSQQILAAIRDSELNERVAQLLLEHCDHSRTYGEHSLMQRGHVLGEGSMHRVYRVGEVEEGHVALRLRKDLRSAKRRKRVTDALADFVTARGWEGIQVPKFIGAVHYNNQGDSFWGIFLEDVSENRKYILREEEPDQPLFRRFLNDGKKHFFDPSNKQVDNRYFLDPPKISIGRTERPEGLRYVQEGAFLNFP